MSDDRFLAHSPAASKLAEELLGRPLERINSPGHWHIFTSTVFDGYQKTVDEAANYAREWSKRGADL